MKKRISYLLAAVLFISILPVFNVRATPQLPVAIFNMTPQQTPNNFEYSLRMQWRRPNFESATSIDMGDGGADVYGIFTRNASSTRSTAYPSDLLPPATANNQFRFPLTGTDDKTDWDETLRPYFEPGCLYVFKIVPYHTHVVINPTTLVPTFTTIRGPASGSSQAANEIIFLSDLEVSANATTSTLNVSWSNPTFDRGTQIFTSYRITYGSSKDMNGNVVGQSRTVSLDDRDLRVVPNGEYTRFAYTMEVSLIMENRYYVQVEPMFGAVPAASRDDMVIGSTLYNFRINPGKKYITPEPNGFSVQPPLKISDVVEGDSLVLSWDDLARSGELKGLKLFSSNTVADYPNNGRLIETIEGNFPATLTRSLVRPLPQRETFYWYLLDYVGAVTPVASNIVSYKPTGFAFPLVKPTILDAIKVPANEMQYPTAIKIIWEAFYRQPTTLDEQDLV
ncbi:MAG: fibronectin type III domain-containing protein, partial [Defluviitaleaceae bacterium]|nr:fibronectin type III domain-containing protein [Defluviitaleaceae bacterium]